MCMCMCMFISTQWWSQDFRLRGQDQKRVKLFIKKKKNKQLYANVIVIYNLNLVCKKNLGLRLKNASEERKNCYT